MRKRTGIVLVLLGVLIGITTIYSGQKSQEIVITINPISADEKVGYFFKGDDLRREMKFNDAINEYMKVLEGELPCGKESEAKYNIGLCYTWMGQFDDAKNCFNQVIELYPTDGVAFSYAQYGLTWIDVQIMNYEAAIKRLEETLDNKLCQDTEFRAMALFEIGRIYGAYLGDWNRAQEYFKVVLDQYPNSKITNHLFFINLNTN